jgi:hypothetical protein
VTILVIGIALVLSIVVARLSAGLTLQRSDDCLAKRIAIGVVVIF